MIVSINAKRLRATLPDVVNRVRKGTRFTVIYRSRPAFPICGSAVERRRARAAQRSAISMNSLRVIAVPKDSKSRTSNTKAPPPPITLSR